MFFGPARRAKGWLDIYLHAIIFQDQRAGFVVVSLEVVDFCSYLERIKLWRTKLFLTTVYTCLRSIYIQYCFSFWTFWFSLWYWAPRIERHLFLRRSASAVKNIPGSLVYLGSVLDYYGITISHDEKNILWTKLFLFCFFFQLSWSLGRWFGILGVIWSNNPFQEGILGIQTTNPNRQLTSWLNEKVKFYSTENVLMTIYCTTTCCFLAKV